MRGNGNQALCPARRRGGNPGSHAAKAGVNFGEPSRGRHGYGVGGELRDLLDEPGNVLTRGERHDPQAIRMRRHDRERALADGTSRSEDGNPLHDACRYLVNT